MCVGGGGGIGLYSFDMGVSNGNDDYERPVVRGNFTYGQPEGSGCHPLIVTENWSLSRLWRQSRLPVQARPVCMSKFGAFMGIQVSWISRNVPIQLGGIGVSRAAIERD